MSAGKVLFIDAYDSFSNNIINLLRDRLSVTVSSVYIDDPRFVFNDDAFHEHLQQFDAVVAGPGPGHPANPQDIGLIAKLWTLAGENLLPVLGICLGFQSLCLAYGGTVDRLTQPRHGLVTPITHCGGDVYTDTGLVRATQYHSLHVSIGPDDNGTRSDQTLFTPTKACPEMYPLAWDLSDPENGPIFMSTKHVSKPFTGVQYHPESICTNDEGHKLVDKWWQAACTWNARNRTDDFFPPLGASRPSHHTNGHAPKSSSHDSLASSVHWTSFNPGKPLDAASVVQALRSQTHTLEPLLLESGTRASGEPVNPETGRFSIIGLQEASSTHVRYSTSNHLVQVTNGSNMMPFKTSVTTPEVFTILETLVQSRRALGGPSQSPFWGGFIGFISYEAGLETIDVAPPEPTQERPDIWFVFVERSIVIDHVEGQVYIQTLHQNDDAWLAATKTLLSSPTNAESAKPKPSNGTTTKHPAQITSQPSRAEYQAKVHACQSHLRAGSSYELCLTDSTSIRTPESAWSLYQRLRAANPAPFSAYLNFAGVTFHPIDGSATPSGDSIQIVGSSPERFLSWTRDSGRIQFRPIKGTVKKTPTTTRAMAEELLKSPKEQAENLMIVDLIRHDLSGVPGVSGIHVPHLMAVEEYATVYQLVSVIAGTLDADAPTTKTGLNVLAASLPPGSMTGAPKKRSCALLAGIEGREKPRGVYSGVLGYLDVGGGGDFSVVIRTAFRYGGAGGDGAGAGEDGDDGDWQIGAGGAVTVLSEAEAEWEEMLAKRESLLKVFGGVVGA
jgi:para-aminobenzoate synthetase